MAPAVRRQRFDGLADELRLGGRELGDEKIAEVVTMTVVDAGLAVPVLPMTMSNRTAMDDELRDMIHANTADWGITSDRSRSTVPRFRLRCRMP